MDPRLAARTKRLRPDNHPDLNKEKGLFLDDKILRDIYHQNIRKRYVNLVLALIGTLFILFAFAFSGYDKIFYSLIFIGTTILLCNTMLVSYMQQRKDMDLEVFVNNYVQTEYRSLFLPN